MAILETICKGRTPRRFGDIGEINYTLQNHIDAIDRAIPGRKPPKYKQRIARIVHDQATDLKWLKENFAIEFEATEIAEVAANVHPEDLNSFHDLCNVDEARLAHSRTAIADEIPSSRMKQNAPQLQLDLATRKKPRLSGISYCVSK